MSRNQSDFEVAVGYYARRIFKVPVQNFYYRVRNLINYFPVIWNDNIGDRHGEFSFYLLMEKKMILWRRDIASCIDYEDKEKHLADMDAVLGLLNDILENNFSDDAAENRKESNKAKAKIFKILEKNSYKWWM